MQNLLYSVGWGTKFVHTTLLSCHFPNCSKHSCVRPDKSDASSPKLFPSTLQLETHKSDLSFAPTLRMSQHRLRIICTSVMMHSTTHALVGRTLDSYVIPTLHRPFSGIAQKTRTRMSYKGLLNLTEGAIYPFAVASTVASAAHLSELVAETMI
jgi:hypothetical protein